MAVPPGEPLDGTYWVPALTPEPVGAFTTPPRTNFANKIPHLRGFS
jgi:hypothetical protein